MNYNEYGVWVGPTCKYVCGDTQRYAEIETAQTPDGFKYRTAYCTGTIGASAPILQTSPSFPDHESAVAAARHALLCSLDRVVEGPDSSRYGPGDKNAAKKFIVWLGFVKESGQVQFPLFEANP